MVEEVIGCKWTVRLLWLLSDGLARPSRLLKACPGLSTKVMNERLRKLTRFGLLDRRVHGEKPPVVVEYRLTPLGRRFMRVLVEVKKLQAALKRGVGQGDAPTRGF
jgi:DNA-binding HxlR family transcriptional regulator